MGGNLKMGREEGSGEGYTKSSVSRNPGCMVVLISCPFGAQLESVIKYPLAAIKLVL